MESHDITLDLVLNDGYEFTVRFDRPHGLELVTDESSPLGAEHGPNPARLLAAAIGNCLAASLLFCLRKAKIDVRALEATVHTTLIRNERGRLRIGPVRVSLRPDVAPNDRTRMDRCLELFEDFCIVTESVRQGVDVSVAVDTGAGVGAGH